MHRLGLLTRPLVVVALAVTATVVPLTGVAHSAGPAAGGGLLTQADPAPTCTPETIGGANYERCVLSDQAAVVDLATLLPGGVDRNAPIWIQAWGGKGGDSGAATPDGSSAPGGAAGFAQTITSIDDYEQRFATTNLYYALSDWAAAENTDDPAAGRQGDGGASTIVSSINPAGALDVNSNVLVIAGGGGGAAVACPQYGQAPCQAAAGGAGGVALANQAQVAPAQPGVAGGPAGGAGVGGLAGDSLSNGSDGVGGLGGGLFTTEFKLGLTVSPEFNGAGGAQVDCPSFDEHPYCARGGGGGGWGGGAAGFYTTLTPRASAGGGGGSFAAPANVGDQNAPTQPVAGPATGEGEVHLVISVDTPSVPPTCTFETVGAATYQRCVVSEESTFVDLALLDGVTDDTTIWIQAWGGKAADGGPSSPDNAVAPGGVSGFSQVVTTVDDYRTRYGTTLLHYLLGNKGVGGFGDPARGLTGSGGAATLVAATPPADGLDVNSNVVAIAGGGGAGVTYCPFSGCVTNSTYNGGPGGVAMSNAGGQQTPAGAGQSGGPGGGAGVGGA
ncbi:MAG: hypothetical protein AAFY28_10830, partial [Actinomycetota bacterium]